MVSDSSDLTDFYEANPDLDPDQLPDSDKEIGSRIARARAENGMTRDELGSQLGVRPATIRRWESGQATPRPNRMSTIAGILGVSVSWLLIGHGESPTADGELARIKGDLARVRRGLTDTLAEVDAMSARIDAIEA